MSPRVRTAPPGEIERGSERPAMDRVRGLARAPRRLLALAGLCLPLLACTGGERVRPEESELGLEPEDSPAELYVRMAEEYFNRGQIEVALRRAQQAIQADRGYARAHVWQAFIYERIEQGERARQHYEEAARLAPNNSDVRYAYGAYLCRQQRYAEADAEFVRALANPLYATPWVAMTNAGICAASSGDRARAERYFRDAIAANPNFGPAYVRLAELAHENGDNQAARDWLERFFAPTTPRNAETSFGALLVGVKVERALGNRRRADEYARTLKTNFPNAPETRGL